MRGKVRWMRAVSLIVLALTACLGSTRTVLADSTRAGAPVLGTLVMQGALTSDSTLTMTGAFSVGHSTELTWDLPRLTSVSLNGYSQRVDAIAYRFNLSPADAHDTVVDGVPVRRFHWVSPPYDQVIDVSATMHVVTQSTLSPFDDSAAYPVAALPATTSPYLQATRFTRLPSSASTLLGHLTAGKRTERQVVGAIANYVAATTEYSTTPVVHPHTAAWVLAHHWATCQGYANLMTGLLRAVGIPTRVEYGWVSSRALQLPGPQNGTSFVRWPAGANQSLHVWLSVYFPGAGWVPFDPQHEKFFVDPRHFALMSTVDASDHAIGTWSAVPVDGSSTTGRALANGATQIVPGLGAGSSVIVQSHDRNAVRITHVLHDVRNTLLFSR